MSLCFSHENILNTAFVQKSPPASELNPEKQTLKEKSLLS